MRWFDAGQFAEGVVALGQDARGVLAIGQGATGVIAIGQLSRGVIAVGQLAVGVFAFGQLAVGLAWAGGMVSVGGLKGPALLGFGVFGEWPWSDLRRLRLGGITWSQSTIWWLQPAALITVVVLVWLVCLQPLGSELFGDGGVLREPPPTPPPPTPSPTVLQ